MMQGRHLVCVLWMSVIALFGACSTSPGTGSAPASLRAGPHAAKGVPSRGPREASPKVPANCQFSRSAQGITSSRAIDDEFEGVALHWSASRVTHMSSSGRRREHLGSEVTIGITTNGEIVMQVEHRVGPGSAEAAEVTSTVKYGPTVQGLRSASITVKSGTVSGTVNDRSIVPFRVEKAIDAGSIRYADGNPAPEVTIHPSLRAALSALHERLKNADPVEGGGIPSSWDGTDQNNLLDWATPHCQSCTGGCENVGNFLCPPCLAGCIGGCFIPVAGGCAQQVCAELGFGACDNDQSCCGTICCGSDQVCGNNSLGTCCPKDYPVACGDETEMLCFLPGSTCCGDSIFACEPGSSCVPGSSPGAFNCCPNDRTCDGACCSPPASCQRTSGGKGVCCQTPLCGDECCAHGEICHNGKCGFGQPCGSTFCGFGSTCCSGVCCAGTCLNGNQCCPSALQVCGHTCCPPGQLCANASTSTCAAPRQATLSLYDPPNGAFLGTSGGPPVRISNNQGLTVKGQSFAPGSVVLSVDTASGPTLATAHADGSGAFSVNITTERFSPGSHRIVASQGSRTASVAVTVEAVQ
jgi:hypothetical protein